MATFLHTVAADALQAVTFADVMSARLAQPRDALRGAEHRPAVCFMLSELLKPTTNDARNDYNKRAAIGNDSATYAAMRPSVTLARAGNAYHASADVADAAGDTCHTSPAWRGSVAVCHAGYAAAVRLAAAGESVTRDTLAAAIKAEPAAVAFGESKTRKTLASMLSECVMFGLMRPAGDGRVTLADAAGVMTLAEARAAAEAEAQPSGDTAEPSETAGESEPSGDTAEPTAEAQPTTRRRRGRQAAE